MTLWLQMTYLSCVIMVSSTWADNHSSHLASTELKRQSRETVKENQKGTNKQGITTQDEDEEKKTLAQQVIDGKYGLIQNELFSSPVKRPGVLSYEINPEVPRDNINNFGGLKSDEIWLAENHLLVLKGGGFRNNRKKTNWPPIDDYVAPKRRVKIPSNPKVPPPFPIQLEEGGPIEVIQAKQNGTRGGAEGGRRGSPHLPPLFPPLDPGGGELDEDDPRIYYPPPYDFIFEKDNGTNHVPPGPLVPGIVLPPPPDFFAPLRPSKTPRPHVKDKKPPPRDKKPKDRPTNNNEVQAKTKSKVDVLEGGWIPIPGPPQTQVPYSPKIKDGQMIMDNSTTTKNPLNSRSHYFKVVDPKLHSEYGYGDTSKGNFYTTTSIPYEGFEPVIVNLRTEVRTTVAPAYSYPVSFSKDKKVEETYYFYQDPYDLQGKLVEPSNRNTQSTKKPKVQIIQKGRKVNFETNTLAPPKFYEEVSIGSENAGPSSVGINNYGQSYVKATPEQDFQYVYYNKNPHFAKDSGYTYQIPRDPYDGSAIEFFENDGSREYSKAPSTSKTPIYEYSFSAPGYGTSEPPKIATTPKPVAVAPAHRQPQYSFFEYQTTPKNKNIFNFNPSTIRPSIYVTQKPTFEQGHAYSGIQSLFQTSSPFNTFITRNPGSTEDITKKYFTLFGQKINQASLNEQGTTPLPPRTQIKQSKPFYEDSFRGMINEDSKESNRQHVRYQSQPYDIAAEDPYYLKAQEYHIQNYKVRLVKPDNNIPQQLKFSNFYSTSLPQYDHYEYEKDVVQPNHPLASDIEVNFRQRPIINPEAELIDTQLINQQNLGGNSYISYQLPGSGGHFYFLTPRSVGNYHLPNSGFRYINDGDAEYRGNARNQQQRQRRRPDINN